MTLLTSFPHPVRPVGEEGKGLAQSPGDHPVKKGTKEESLRKSWGQKSKKVRRESGERRREQFSGATSRAPWGGGTGDL